MRRRSVTWAIGVSAFAVGGLLLIRAVSRERQLGDDLEVRAGLRALCAGVVEHHRAQGEWLTAGPQPPVIPKEPVEFPKDPAFERLGFAPGQVRHQYEVITSDGGTRCIARGPSDVVIELSVR